MTTPTDLVLPENAATAEFPAVELTLLDRCDGCGAQAFVRASILAQDIDKMVDLLFCAHHFKKYETSLREKALHIQDDSERINKKASASSGTSADAL